MDPDENEDQNESTTVLDDNNQEDVDLDPKSKEYSNYNQSDDIFIQTTEGKISIKNKQFISSNIDSFDIFAHENILIDISDDQENHHDDIIIQTTELFSPISQLDGNDDLSEQEIEIDSGSKTKKRYIF
jgi:hypothetical protein